MSKMGFECSEQQKREEKAKFEKIVANGEV